MAFLGALLGGGPSTKRLEDFEGMDPSRASGLIREAQREGLQKRIAYEDRGEGFQRRGPATMQAANLERAFAADPRMAGLGGSEDAFLANLAAQASGQAGPSVAELQLQRSREQALRDAQAMSRRGGAAGLRGAINAAADINRDTAMNAAILRAQEQQAAQQLYGSQLGQAMGIQSGLRGQDIGLATTQAGFNQQANQANLQAAMEQRQQNDLMQKFMYEYGMNLEQAQIAAARYKVAAEMDAHAQELDAAKAEANVNTQQREQDWQMLGDMANTGSSISGLAATGIPGA